MNTKTLSISLLSCLILVSIIFLAGCSPFAGAPVVMAQSDTVEEFPVSGSDIVQHLESDETTFSLSNTSAEADLIEEDTSRTWEMDAADISAARQAAMTLSQKYTAAGVDLVEEGFLRSWEIDADDIAAARQAAFALSQTNDVGEVDFDAADLVSGELDASDISAARQAAQYLAEAERVSHELSTADISAARQAAQHLTADGYVAGELDAGDIAAARVASQTLSNIFVAGGVDLKNPAFLRTTAELEWARKFRASEEYLAVLSAE